MTLAKRQPTTVAKAPRQNAARRRAPAAKASTSPIEDAIEARRIREGRRGYYDDEILAIVKERGASGDFITMEEFYRQLDKDD